VNKSSQEFSDLLEKLAEEIVELHIATGIELEQWDTAYQFIKVYYNTEEMVQILIGPKRS
jgi:hypothetical protein